MTEKYAMVIAFTVLLIGLAYRSYRRIKSYQDYNLAGRNTGFPALVATLGAAEFNTATLIGGASVAYLYGTVGLWYTSFIFVFVFGIYAFTVAKPYRRLRIATIAEFFERRFHGRLAETTRALASVVTLTFTWIAPATYLAGLSVVASVLLGVDPLTTVIVITTLCLFLALAGGFMTAVSFDVVAYTMIVIFVPVIFFVGFFNAGGFGELSKVFDPEYLSFEPIWDLDNYGFAAIMTWCLQNILLYVAAPWYGQRIFSARNERIAYRAMLTNTVLIVVLYALVALATMFSRVVLPNLDNPEEALPRLVLEYTPPIIQGLLLVTLLLVGISTMVAIWNSAVSIVVNDLLKRYLFRARTDRFYVLSSRVVFLVLGASTLVFALTFVGNILLALTYVSVYTAMLAFPILAGLYWKRFTTEAALSSLAVGVGYVTVALLANFPYHLVSPVGIVLSAIVGTTVTFARRKTTVDPRVEEFFAIAHGRKELNHAEV
ncbi:SSS family solute:Na+ symporter [Tamaricihabitans halophyticus]|uniref:SSS family solute:Na+ symporter n=1 Tax=Tamaricihabitans halophyticus TaxID=1262583 RepID=A0A4R2QIH6_9PSEU|nr:sodium:solute symporter family protein [Tamaricihabitans halophyticus]TCP48474.1 SSS family solute:Na+ symporter [Tamaricihabitans halophyticus]